MTREPTNQDILEAIYSFSTAVDERFASIDGRFIALEKQINERFAAVDIRFNEMDVRLADMQAEINSIDSRLDHMEIRFDRFEKVVMEDHKAFAKQFLGLDKRVNTVERVLKKRGYLA